MSRLLTRLPALLAIALTTSLLAQVPAAPTRSLNRPLPTWTQAEREFGFSRWDSIFPARVVKRGTRVHPLPDGAPIRAFFAGGSAAQKLDEYAAAYQLAGLVVLQEGKIRAGTVACTIFLAEHDCSCRGRGGATVTVRPYV